MIGHKRKALASDFELLSSAISIVHHLGVQPLKRFEQLSSVSRRAYPSLAAKVGNRCETVIWLHNPNVTSRLISTFGLSNVAASFHPNARHQPQGARTTCHRIFRACSGRISQLPREWYRA